MTVKRPKLPRVERIYVEVARTFRTTREALHMTQEQLAKRVGLTRTSIVNFEAGRQRCMLHQIERMARVLHIKFLRLI
jgi:DNA-binding XRE family transcriptional regulator